MKYLNPNHTMLVTVPRIAALFFIALQSLGMKVYPGGTMYDASTQGYSFSKNFVEKLPFLKTDDCVSESFEDSGIAERLNALLENLESR